MEATQRMARTAQSEHGGERAWRRAASDFGTGSRTRGARGTGANARDRRTVARERICARERTRRGGVGAKDEVGGRRRRRIRPWRRRGRRGPVADEGGRRVSGTAAREFEPRGLNSRWWCARRRRWCVASSPRRCSSCSGRCSSRCVCSFTPVGEDLFRGRPLRPGGHGLSGRRRRRAGWDISTTRRTSASCEVRVSAGRR